MGSEKGRFKRSPINEYFVECECGDDFVIHYSTMNEAKRAAKESGWRIRSKKWICPYCAAKAEGKEASDGE